VRRFYFEMVRARNEGLFENTLQALAHPGLISTLQWLSNAADRQGQKVRIAALLELPRKPTTRLEGQVHRAVESVSGLSNLSLDLWLQLPDDGTRFLNTTTAHRYARGIQWLFELQRRGGDGVPFGIGLDAEPNQAWLAAAWRFPHPHRHPRYLRDALWPLAKGALRHPSRLRRGRRDLKALFEAARVQGAPLHTATIPAFSSGPMGRFLRAAVMGVPDTGTSAAEPFGIRAPMFYLPLLRHVSGRKRRAFERRQLLRWIKNHQAQRGRLGQDAPAAAILGPTSHGVLGTEPVYDALGDLAADLGTLVHLGYRDIGFFSLEGFLWGRRGRPLRSTLSPTRPDWRRWLEVALSDGECGEVLP
jgi:hypothetical protein